tara:strand:- start:31 stop:1488 length:1458 start_codon:yes stop_codon:yes gene_type:complete
MGGIFGSKKTYHHHHTNPYNDDWIRRWMKEADRIKLYYHGRIEKNRKEDHRQNQERNLLKQRQEALFRDRDALSRRLSSAETSFIDQLAGVQSTFSSERASVEDAIRAAEAGWQDDVAAWNQQGADWTKQFSQQQRSFETQLAEQLAEQKGVFESERAIRGEETAEQRAAWEQSAAEQRKEYEDQLRRSGLQSDEEIEQLKSVFAQQQEDFRLAAQQERKTLESQLGTQYTEQWDKQQRELTTKYQDLLGAATSEAEAARLAQARDFEQKQLDQQAAWNQQAQALSTTDELYGARLDELKSGLGIQRQQLGSQISDLGAFASQERDILGQQLASLGQSSEAARSELGANLGSQISTLGQASEAARSQLGSQLGSQISAIGQTGETEREFIKGDIAKIQSNFDTATIQAGAERDQLKDSIRRNQEMAILANERARTAASYGSQGQPTNQQVKGVRTINELKPGGQMGMGTGGSFNRKGLRIRNLNI